MLRRLFLASLTLSVITALSACTVGPRDLAFAPNSTLIVTRHGDRESENLSNKGWDRARALVTALDGMPLDAIHAPGIQRNMDTATPLSQARALPIERIAQENPTAKLVASAADRTVIWIGNKGNIKTIWADLNLPDPAPLNYGDLQILRSDAHGKVTIETRHYGPKD